MVTRVAGGAVITIAAAILVAIGFLAMLQPHRQAWRGASQRLADGAIFAWIAWASLALSRALAAPNSQRPGAHIGGPARRVGDA